MAATFSITLDKKLVVAKTKTTEDEDRRPKTRKRRPENADPKTKTLAPFFFLFYFIRTPIRRRFNTAIYFLIIASICPPLPCCPHSISTIKERRRAVESR